MPKVMKRMKSFIRRFTRIIRMVFHSRVGEMKEFFEFLHLKLDELSWCWKMTLNLRKTSKGNCEDDGDGTWRWMDISSAMQGILVYIFSKNIWMSGSRAHKEGI